MLLGLCGTASAAPLKLEKIADKLKEVELKQGLAWSLSDNKLNYTSTFDIASWKGVSLGVGYAGAAPNTAHKAVAVVSYPLVKLDKYLDMPILDLIELEAGAFLGAGNISFAGDDFSNQNEFDWGLSLTVLKVDF